MNGIIDNQDELLSVAMTEAARDKENSENRKKRPGYTAYDEDDGSTPGLALGRKKELLSQYDSEIYGPKQTGFTLSSGGVADSVRQEETLSVAEKLKASAAVTLDYAKNGAIQDYYTQDEIATTTFRKTKKSGKKKTSSATKNSRRKKTPEPEEQASLEDTEMTDDGQAQFSKSNKASSLEDINFVDDDDLQAALSRARKLAASKQKAAATGAEEVAQGMLYILRLHFLHYLHCDTAIANMKQESESDAEEAHNGLVISDTTEFVRTLLHSTVTEPKPKGRLGAVQEKKESSQIKQEPVEEEEVTQMDVEGTEIEETVIEDSKDDIKMETDSDDSGEAAVAEEPLVSRGMAATLALLSQKGVVQLASPEERARQQKLRERELWLVEERKKEKLRQLDQDKDRQRTRALEKSGRLTGREIERQREEEARRLERERFKLAEEKFKNYIPDVKIEYRDEFGRQLSTKEVFIFATFFIRTKNLICLLEK